MSDAGAAQKRPALRGGPSLVRFVVAPRSHSPAMLSRRASPRSQIWASQLSRLFRDGPLAGKRPQGHQGEHGEVMLDGIVILTKEIGCLDLNPYIPNRLSIHLGS